VTSTNVVGVLDKSVLTRDIQREEVYAWLATWRRTARVDDSTVRDTYPMYMSPIFTRNLATMGEMLARFVHRNHSLFSAYYRPHLQQLWSRRVHYPTPQDLIGVD
jgi:hypothetical protein